MSKYLMMAAAMVFAAGMAGCDNGYNGSAGPKPVTPPPPVTTVSFPQFVSTDVTTGTCDKMSATEVDPIDFTFDADQDTAAPIVADSLPTPGCST